MLDAEGMNVKIGVEGSNPGGKKIPRTFGGKRDNPTLSDILDFLERSSLTDQEKERLASVAKKMPNGCLSNFKANYRNYLKNK